MNIYGNTGIIDEKELPEGTTEASFTVERVSITKAKPYGPAIALQLRETTNGDIVGYGLIGRDLITQFVTDSRVCYIEDLMGKTLVGKVSSRKDRILGLVA